MKKIQVDDKHVLIDLNEVGWYELHCSEHGRTDTIKAEVAESIKTVCPACRKVNAAGCFKLNEEQRAFITEAVQLAIRLDRSVFEVCEDMVKAMRFVKSNVESDNQGNKSPVIDELVIAAKKAGEGSPEQVIQDNLKLMSDKIKKIKHSLKEDEKRFKIEFPPLDSALCAGFPFPTTDADKDRFLKSYNFIKENARIVKKVD